VIAVHNVQADLAGVGGRFSLGTTHTHPIWPLLGELHRIEMSYYVWRIIARTAYLIKKLGLDSAYRYEATGSRVFGDNTGAIFENFG
jgi:hypothetical protein